MTNLVIIALTQKCNINCSYCSIRDFRNKFDLTLTNERILNFLDKHFSPTEWLIELTGGEPALYPELEILLDELEKRNYKGLIKTNGILSISKRKNFKRIAAFHDYAKKPKYFDEILIIENQSFEDKKIKWCEKHSIKYKFIGFCDPENKIKRKRYAQKYIKKMTTISPQGNSRMCFHWRPDAHTVAVPEMQLEIISEPETRIPCIYCKALYDFELFADSEWLS